MKNAFRFTFFTLCWGVVFSAQANDNLFTLLRKDSRVKDPVIVEDSMTFAIATPKDTSLVKDINGNTYPIVTIGTQVWMAENLRSSNYSDGTAIPLMADATSWATNYNNKTKLPMMCWYDNDQATYTANKCGALYNWYVVSPTTNGGKNLCPTGWHVPNNAEWTTLIDFLGGETVAGGKMKTTGATQWKSLNMGETNSSGFSGVPGGLRHYDGGFYDIGYFSYWWSSSEVNPFYAWNRYLFYGGGYVYRGAYGKDFGYSVRCLRD
jgi:uncharacterized protein (TIGR02145 family)